ncbi:MAG TPA: metallophosphoesterase [Acidimicrobiales bacterium]|nr:metallophosphoesterase [Acidimicrobiales bacterium]
MSRRVLLRRAGVIGAAALGTMLGLAVAPRVQADVGPFVMSATARPYPDGQTTVRLVPLGSIRLDTHDAPIAVEIRLEELEADEAEAIAKDPSVLADLEDAIAADARSILVAVAWRAILAGLAGGALLAGLVYRSWRASAAGLAVALCLVGGIGIAARATFDPGALAEPKYSGLLASAPTVIGDVDTVLDRFGEYRAQLGELVSNAVTLYRAGQQLPDFEPADDAVRVLHVSDVHNNPQAFDLIQRLIDDFAVDAVFDTGDISDWGTGAETGLTDPIGRLGVPYVFVRGNHDSPATERAIDALSNAQVLDGDVTTVAGLRIWGIGDPRFTPDKRGETGIDVERETINRFAPELRRRLEADTPPAVDVVMVHDVRAAAEISGDVALVLAGHSHEPRYDLIDDTSLLVEGSTGGAGLRALRGEFPEPLTCTLLYFDPRSDRLAAYDRITVAGLGSAAASIERHLVHSSGPPVGSAHWGNPFRNR